MDCRTLARVGDVRGHLAPQLGGATTAQPYTDRPDAYLARDRRRALLEGRTLPDRVRGAAMFADISGFTPLTEALANELGATRAAEELTAHLDRVFGAVIDDVHHFDGNVIYFAGDAITCWFDGDDGRRAAASALAIQATMARVGQALTPGGAEVRLAIKVALAVGSARRFVVGDPDIQLIDVLAGRLVDELADAEHLAEKGDVVLAASAIAALGDVAVVAERREVDGAVGAVLTGLTDAVPTATDDVEPPPLDAETVRAWLLPAVYERLSAGRGEFLGELRPAYPVFVNFGGIDFDEDPDAIELLDTFVRRSQAVFARHGGNLLQLTLGDKGAYLYAVFGSPHAHEEDAVRAAAAALELLELERDTAATDIRVGVTQGRVRSGTTGHPTRRTFTCLGDAVNLAARLMSKAPPGSIYVNGEVARAVEDRFEVHAVGEMALKGKAKQVTVHAVTGVRHRVADRQRRYTLPMVGRDAEMAELTDARDAVLDGRGQVVGIAAEAGRGKSRLVAELARALRDRDVDVVWGEAQATGQATSYLAWREVWQRLLGVDDEADSADVAAHLERRLAVLGRDHARRAPLLAAVLGVALPDNDLTSRFDAKLRKASLESLLVDVLTARAATAPVAIVLEDGHWLDPLSRDLLDELVRAITALPVLVVVAYRPTAEPAAGLGLHAFGHFRELELGELGPEQAELVLRAKLEQVFGAEVHAAPELLELIAARAQGNPFYLEEIVNFVAERGIDPGDGPAIRALDVPDSLQRLVLSRIDLLAEEPRRTLKVASVVGRGFESPFVDEVYPDLGGLAAVEAGLVVARDADLVVEDRIEERSWLFRHVVTREVAYESIPFALRQTLHDRVGEHLEERGAGDADLDALAYHYWRGRDDSKKREYVLRAGIAAQARYANAVAADYFRQVLPLLDEAERPGVMRRLGKVLEIQGAWAEAEQTHRAAVDLALGLGDGAAAGTAHADLAEAMRKQGRFADAGAQLVEARRLFSEADDEAGLGLVLQLEGTLASQQGHYDEARAAYEASMEIRTRLDDRLALGSLLSNLAIVAECVGDVARAREMNERALAVRQEVGDRWAVSVSQNNLGMVALAQRDWEGARHRFAESMRLAEEVGDRWVVAVGHHNQGNAMVGLRRFVDAAAEFTHALDAYAAYDDQWSIALLIEDVVPLVAGLEQWSTAVHLMAAADALRAQLDAPRPPAVEAALAQAMTGAPDFAPDAGVAAGESGSDAGATMLREALAAVVNLG